jgi:hypothetical protein
VKVLLDENLAHRLRKNLGTHEVFTVGYKGWAGLKNGELLRTAEENGIEVFLTGDRPQISTWPLRRRSDRPPDRGKPKVFAENYTATAHNDHMSRLYWSTQRTVSEPEKTSRPTHPPSFGVCF